MKAHQKAGDEEVASAGSLRKPQGHSMHGATSAWIEKDDGDHGGHDDTLPVHEASEPKALLRAQGMEPNLSSPVAALELTSSRASTSHNAKEGTSEVTVYEGNYDGKGEDGPITAYLAFWEPFGGVYSKPTYHIRDGICWVSGCLKNVAEREWNEIVQLPRNCRPHQKLFFLVNNHDIGTQVSVDTTGIVKYVAGGMGHQWVSLSAIAFATENAPASPLPGFYGSRKMANNDAWQSWSTHYYDAGFPRYTVSRGICFLQGLVGNPNAQEGSRITVLPVDCRPRKRLEFAVANGEMPGVVSVEADGSLIWRSKTAETESPVSLCGIVFTIAFSENVGLVQTLGTWSGVVIYPSGPIPGERDVELQLKGILQGDTALTYTVMHNVCVLEGGVSKGSVSDIRGNRLAQLPFDCRPDKRLVFNGNNGYGLSRIDVTTLGVVTWVAGAQQDEWISLSGIIITLPMRLRTGPPGPPGPRGDRGVAGTAAEWALKALRVLWASLGLRDQKVLRDHSLLIPSMSGRLRVLFGMMAYGLTS